MFQRLLFLIQFTPLFPFSDKNYFEWFYYSWLSWQMDANHQVSRSDSFCICGLELGKGGSHGPYCMLYRKYIFLSIPQVW